MHFIGFFLLFFIPLILLSFQVYCLRCTPCSCLHLLLGCAPVLSAHVKLRSVLNLWLPSSLKHPISISMVFFPSPSCSSISLFLFVLQHFFRPPPAFSSQGYLGFPSLFTSLSPPCSLPYSTYLSFTFTRCQHFVLLPLLLLHLSPSSLSVILSASPHHACELSPCLCSHQKLLALPWSSVTWIKAHHSMYEQ